MRPSEAACTGCVRLHFCGAAECPRVARQVVMAGGLLNSCSQLLSRGIHPNQISESYQLACRKATDIMQVAPSPHPLPGICWPVGGAMCRVTLSPVCARAACCLVYACAVRL